MCCRNPYWAMCLKILTKADFLRSFRGPIRVPRIENRVPRIRKIGSLQVQSGYVTFSLKNPELKCLCLSQIHFDFASFCFFQFWKNKPKEWLKRAVNNWILYQSTNIWNPQIYAQLPVRAPPLCDRCFPLTTIWSYTFKTNTGSVFIALELSFCRYNAWLFRLRETTSCTYVISYFCEYLLSYVFW